MKELAKKTKNMKDLRDKCGRPWEGSKERVLVSHNYKVWLNEEKGEDQHLYMWSSLKGDKLWAIAP